MKIFAPLLMLVAMILATPQFAAAGGNAHGTFTGDNNHITTGGVEIVKAAGGGWEIHLKEDFSLDGAPDPRVGLGKGGKFTEGTDFEVLHNKTGAQVYKVPADINPEEFDTVFIWCRKFSVSLGHASLSK